MAQLSEPAVMHLCLGELGKGQGYRPWASPSQILGPEQVSKGQIKSDPPLDQEKGQSAFSQKHKALSCTALPACLTGLKCGEEVSRTGGEAKGVL